jgi:putative membrane protein
MLANDAGSELKVSRSVATGVKQFLQRWLITTLAVFLAAYLVKGIHSQSSLDLVMAALLLGVLNAVLRPVLLLLSLPLLIFSLGLFTLVINAALLYLVGFLLRPHFYVDSFGTAFLGALIISVISVVLNILTGTGHSRIRVTRHRRPPQRDRDGGGPVIDV